MVQNKTLNFKKVPVGYPVPGQDLAIETSEFDVNQAPPQGGITVKIYYVSFDPYQRGRMRPAEVKSYSPPYELNGPINNSAVAKVLKSDSNKFKEGDLIICMLPTAEYASVPQQLVDKTARKIENPFNLDPRMFLAALGMPGLTAYSSYHEIGKPKKGETIFVSAASGAVGQMVGQLAKHDGLTVIGSVGSDEKLNFILNDLEFDAGFNYKKEKPADALKRLAPNGVDIYYENVGGEHLDAALEAMNNFGRIVGCGMVSQYNKPPAQQYAIRNIINLVSKRLTLRGFIVGDVDMGPKYFAEHQKNVQQWVHDGSLKVQMSQTDGIDKAADGFLGMLKGENFGKAVLKVADLD
ncbi:MAG: hypothetical protein M1834_005904 [Cirrosporium novae-zelandiae]|nr:MAG: hypothetical protein M1834_005904 [Cirrosporium novae-zelandiae]